MNRAWPVLLFLLLPSATAHSGSDLNPLTPWGSTVAPDDPVHTFPLLYPVSQQSVGDVLLVSLQNQGPADLDVYLVRTETDVEHWTLPGDGVVQHRTHRLATVGNYTLRFESTSPTDPADIRFMWDTEALCGQGVEGLCSKRLPYETVDARIDGPAIIVPLHAQEAGPYRTTVGENPVHDLEATVWAEDMRTEGTFRTHSTSLGELVVDWTAASPGTYHLVLTSTAVHADVFEDIYAEQGGGAAFESLRVTTRTEGPLVQSTPSLSAPLSVTALLTLAFMVRKKR